MFFSDYYLSVYSIVLRRGASDDFYTFLEEVLSIAGVLLGIAVIIGIIKGMQLRNVPASQVNAKVLSITPVGNGDVKDVVFETSDGERLSFRIYTPTSFVVGDKGELSYKDGRFFVSFYRTASSEN